MKARIVWPGYPQLDDARAASSEELEFEAMGNVYEIGDVPMPSRKALEKIIAAGYISVHPGDQDDLGELYECARWALTFFADATAEEDFPLLVSQNPLTKVFFRAGFLAAREMIARREIANETELGKFLAREIRAFWPVAFKTPDPGPPRLFNFEEIVTEIEKTDGGIAYRSKPINASVEALPRARAFILFNEQEMK